MTVTVSARERPLKKPINGIVGCRCERAASGQIAAVPPTNVMNSRLLMEPQRKSLIDLQSLPPCEGPVSEKGITIDPQTPRPNVRWGSIALF